MNILAFIGQKGGCGKTTLVVHIGVAAFEAGLKVLVIDADPQGSATVWGNARQADEPMVVTVAASELDRVLGMARTERVELAIIDTAPHAAPEAARIARTADLVLIPCRPTVFDLAAAENAAAIAKAARVPAAFVLSACPPRAPIGDARKTLAGYGLPVAPMEITERRAFSRAVAAGRSATEFETDGRAAAETRALWAWIRTKL